MKEINRFIQSPLAFVANICLAYIAYFICRLTFLAENWSMFSENMTWGAFVEIITGGWVFDTSAILYTNVIYSLMMLFPLHLKENKNWQTAAKWVFVSVNAIAIAVNLADCVYFQYTARRTTATVFSEFSNEGNIGSVVGVELLRHWYLLLIFLVMVWTLCKTYRRAKASNIRPYIAYYVVQTVALAAFIPLCIAGMRGGFTTAVRPITISNANQYVDRPLEAGIVLNTPFSVIRTFGKKVFVTPHYYTPDEHPPN